jgi:hypothetical protein
MGELVSIYAIELAQTGKLKVPRQAEVQEADSFEDQQSAKWAKIIAALIFIIAILMMPTFEVDDNQHQNNPSTVMAQTKGAG